MAYVVTSSERLRPSGAESETKALLYLMGLSKDRDEIFYYIVDFINDLTGMSRMSDRMWDVQSKGNKNASPKEIGKELVTLFKNYMSEFEFEEYILFLGGVTGALKKDNSLFCFDISNVKDEAISKIKEGLIEEGEKKTYIQNKDLTVKNIEKFLNRITFVIDNHSKSEYVKNIVPLNPKYIKDEERLEAIFNEIRKEQANKKDTKVVEKSVLKRPEDTLNYGRHLTTKEIEILVVNRILALNIRNLGKPSFFMDIYNQRPPEDKKYLLEDCQAAIIRALFDKNAKDLYWKLFDKVYELIIQYPEDDVHSISEKLDWNLKKKCRHFDVIALKYFIAVVKEVIENEN